MSNRLQHLSKDLEQRKQQLNLLLWNCHVYKISREIRQEYIDELNRLEKE